ncbi:hypothetical protein BVZ79_00251B, partial [Haemophilus influenzae]
FLKCNDWLIGFNDNL